MLTPTDLDRIKLHLAERKSAAEHVQRLAKANLPRIRVSISTRMPSGYYDEITTLQLDTNSHFEWLFRPIFSLVERYWRRTLAHHESWLREHGVEWTS